MIGVIVTFHPDHQLDRSVVAKIAAEARGMFEGMPGLRSKVFTIDPDERPGPQLLRLGLRSGGPRASSPMRWSSASPGSTA